MNRITKEEYNAWTKKNEKVAYVKKYILQCISDDGLVKNDPNISEHETFETEDSAMQFCADRKIYNVVILPIVVKDWWAE